MERVLEVLRDPVWQSVGALIALVPVAAALLRRVRQRRLAQEVVHRAGPETADQYVEDYPNHLGVAQLPKHPREFLRESPQQIIGKITEVHPLDRDGVSRLLFRGRWLRSRGIVFNIQDHSKSYAVHVQSDESGVVLTFPPSMKPVVRSLHQGDQISFEGQVIEVNQYYVELVRPTIRQAPETS